MSKRSREAQQWRHLYNSPRWRALRLKAFKRDGGECQRCGVMLVGREPSPNSPVAHHRTPHKGDRTLFFSADNIESVCKACHDGPIQREEARGYSDAIGQDGLPLDPQHPFNR